MFFNQIPILSLILFQNWNVVRTCFVGSPKISFQFRVKQSRSQSWTRRPPRSSTRTSKNYFWYVSVFL